ncbi:MAG: sensor of ECF-type sigma factor [Polaribacter sp.]
MKKQLYITAFLLLSTFHFFGQANKEKIKKIKALKISFLTEQLKLTATEAEKFWPLYNKHEEILDALRNEGRVEIKKKLKKVGNLENLQEAEAKQLVLQKLNSDKKMFAEKEEFVAKISTFLSYKKIMKLHMAERNFARKLMRKYGRKHKRKHKKTD